MTDLQQQLDEAEARVAQIKRQMAAASCAEVGHRWKHIGGKNCGCDEGWCSFPVHECIACGDCDYGENPEAEKTRADCAKMEARSDG